MLVKCTGEQIVQDLLPIMHKPNYAGNCSKTDETVQDYKKDRRTYKTTHIIRKLLIALDLIWITLALMNKCFTIIKQPNKVCRDLYLEFYTVFFVIFNEVHILVFTLNVVMILDPHLSKQQNSNSF